MMSESEYAESESESNVDSLINSEELSVFIIIESICYNYKKLNKRIHLIDIFILFCICNICIILCYSYVSGTTFPYNSLLAALFCHLGLISFTGMSNMYIARCITMCISIHVCM